MRQSTCAHPRSPAHAITQHSVTPAILSRARNFAHRQRLIAWE